MECLHSGGWKGVNVGTYSIHGVSEYEPILFCDPFCFIPRFEAGKHDELTPPWAKISTRPGRFCSRRRRCERGKRGRSRSLSTIFFHRVAEKRYPQVIGTRSSRGEIPSIPSNFLQTKRSYCNVVPSPKGYCKGYVSSGVIPYSRCHGGQVKSSCTQCAFAKSAIWALGAISILDVAWMCLGFWDVKYMQNRQNLGEVILKVWLGSSGCFTNFWWLI